MLLETDCDLDELRLMDKKRIESLALENDVPAYVTTVRLLEDVEENTSLKLDRVLRAFGRQVAFFTGLFSSREWRRHCDGNGYRTLYAHMSQLKCTAGQAVNQGDVIGLVGSTGDSTGNHCHFEMYYNGARFSAQTYFGGMRASR